MLAYDPATAQLVLFGGAPATYYNDTWAWNGSTWTQTDDTGDAGCTSSCTSSPPGRDRAGERLRPGHRPAHALRRGRRVVDLQQRHLALERLDLGPDRRQRRRRLHHHLPGQPGGPPGGASAFDPATGQLILFGGLVSGAAFSLADTWDWDDAALNLAPSSLSWSASTLNGYDQTLSSAATLDVANEGSGGWDLTIQTSGSFGAGYTMVVNGSGVSAGSATAPGQSCVGTCVAATGNAVTYPLTVPNGSVVNLYTANAGSGIGTVALSTDWWLTVPGEAHTGIAVVTYTLTLSYGP